ncbi:MAG: NlpC/P60 family protein [Desulfosporosinus sp.]|nr:NlpC/P60 family protein [Desulfosporosinus sp.]
MKKFTLVMVLVIVGTISSASLAQAATLKVGSSGTKIRILQSELRTLHYSVGSVDGIYGSKTKAAVRKFQRDEYIPANGIANSRTQDALMKTYRSPRQKQKTKRKIKIKTKTKTNQKIEPIINTAERFLGVPYVWGGTTPAGFDCSGFTRYVFARQGITLPRVSGSQYKVGTPVAFSKLKPEDLVFFNLSSGKRVSHVGIYIGKGKFISATSHKGIAIYGFTPYWAKAYLGARRVL